jgi:sugar transferase (PEP-CTERM system associated)
MPYILKRYYPARNIFFFLGEGLLIFLAVSMVYYIFKRPVLLSGEMAFFGLRALLVTVTFQLCLYFFDLYDLSVNIPASETVARTAQAFGIGCIVLAIIYYLFPTIMISGKIFWTGYVAICVSVFIWRFFYHHALERRLFTQPVLIVGTGPLAADITEQIENKRDSGYKIAAYIGEETPVVNATGVPFFQDVQKMEEICRQQKVERIIVALDDRRGKTPIEELLTCKLKGVQIDKGISFYEEVTGKILVSRVNPAWIIFSSGFKVSRLSYFTKRVADIFLSLFGLLVSLPITVLSAIIIKLESPGGIFYTQERVGENGRIFRVIKFRSMRSDAEKDGPVWAMDNDTRVTRFGGFIRKVRIDEIPQMWNVLKGEMSFVGPRPERPIFVEQLVKSIPYYALRHAVKPGITGWAQICYPYGASEEDALRNLEYDLYYIKNMTLLMDLWVIFQTIKTVLFQKGAR